MDIFITTIIIIIIIKAICVLCRLSLYYNVIGYDGKARCEEWRKMSG